MKIEKIVVFGANGSIGRKIVERALEQGLSVTAFVRNSAKLQIIHPNLRLLEGNVLQANDVEKAVAGSDAVLFAVGAGSKGEIRSTGTKNVIQAMRKQGTKRLICLSSLGVGDSSPTLNLFWKYVMFGLLLRKAFADHQKQEEYIKDSGLEWTIVRPSAFSDANFEGNYKHGNLNKEKNLKLKISRGEVAEFMLNQLYTNQYIKKTPAMSY